LETIFIGAADLAAGKVKALQRPEYRKMFEQAYQEDFKRHNGELSLEKANKILESLAHEHNSKIDEIRKHAPAKIYKQHLLLLNPYILPPEMVDEYTIIDNPFELGHIAQVLYAEKLPSLRLWLHYKDYAIGVVPDGVSDSYVYEFKATTQSGRRVDQVLKHAIRQNIIYAHVFNRPNIKVQIAKFDLPKGSFPLAVKDLPKPNISTVFRPSSCDEAFDILNKFDVIFKIPTHTPDSKQNLTPEEIEFLKRVYKSYGHPIKRHRERQDAEIKFRADEETLNELIRVLGKLFFTGKKSYDKGSPIVRMYGVKQIEDFIKLIEG